MTTVEGLVNGLNLLISITNNRVNICSTVDGIYAFIECHHDANGDQIDPLDAAQTSAMDNWGWMGAEDNWGEFQFRC